MTLKIGINGLGRIGRMVIRAIFENNNNKNIVIKHINNRSNSEISCSLLKYDSIHGKFNTKLNFDKNHLFQILLIDNKLKQYYNYSNINFFYYTKGKVNKKLKKK